MLIGSVGLIITLGVVAWAFYTSDFRGACGAAEPVSIYCLLCVFAGRRLSGCLLPRSFRMKYAPAGEALSSFVHWFMASVIAFTFPILLKSSVAVIRF